MRGAALLLARLAIHSCSHHRILTQLDPLFIFPPKHGQPAGHVDRHAPSSATSPDTR